MVFIGRDMPREVLLGGLDGCVATGKARQAGRRATN
jgi:hypothetical protein